MIAIKLPKRLLEAIEAGNVKKFYKSGIWKKKREQILKRDNYECQRCKENGEFSNRKLQVHHKQELRDRPDLALKNSNLITLCGRCHSEIHGKMSKMQKYNKEKNETKKEKLNIPERW